MFLPLTHFYLARSHHLSLSPAQILHCAQISHICNIVGQHNHFITQVVDVHYLILYYVYKHIASLHS